MGRAPRGGEEEQVEEEEERRGGRGRKDAAGAAAALAPAGRHVARGGRGNFFPEFFQFGANQSPTGREKNSTQIILHMHAMICIGKVYLEFGRRSGGPLLSPLSSLLAPSRAAHARTGRMRSLAPSSFYSSTLDYAYYSRSTSRVL